MGIKRLLIVGMLAVLALSTAAGCTAKGSSSKAKSDTAGSTTTPSDKAGACPGTDATVTITKTGETAKFDHAGGVSLSDGAAYTVYLSDAEIDPSEISMVKTPEPLDDHHLVTVAITVFNAKGTPSPITAGTKIPFTPDFGVLTFRVIDDTVGKSHNSSEDAKGDVVVTKTGDTVCFTVDYSDAEKTLTGTIEAPVKQL